MAKPRLLLLIACFVCISSSFLAAAADGKYQMGWVTNPSTTSCNGSIGDCFGGGEEMEMEMDSEVSRRILATTTYISYGALQRNRVPCSQRGASYYNCQSGGQANPYSRGCSAITQCRS